MKFSASLLLLSALGVGGGANPPTGDEPLQSAGAPYRAPPQAAPGTTPANPLPAPPMTPPIAGDGPRATSGESESRYDEVGFASWYGEELGPNARTASGAAFDPARPIAAHKTLPLGAFVEVTALDTGRTILLEVADRGPHRADRLLDLSRGAAQQLGTHAGSVAAVRVRQVTPSPQDIAALRAGGLAPTRLDAPEILLTALRKRLPGTVSPGSTSAAPAPAAVPASPAVVAPKPPVATSTPQPAAAGRYRVQVATFSTDDRAQALAKRIDGQVERAGSLYRVQLGPFPTSADAKRARDRVAKQGYGDAQIRITD
ncbi:septal ring lytic transglycosylase RlpA family protein [Sphingomonas japonica]|uniref:Endolytic peptidoglycan transglycosylase RlpA n=1 Tax=Sphingomonas japonica TaxID=511662 RepID=A0ABX0U7V9_9SPHN|nr:septal ring lytic transglycosylase RlpA family protein [Sphingomonas japonica]NIJ24858.1 rare lipoprotein A [Sphingomonas japonica]